MSHIELLDIAKCNRLTVQTPFPGTPLYERLEREDRLLEPTNWKTCTLFDVTFGPGR